MIISSKKSILYNNLFLSIYYIYLRMLKTLQKLLNKINIKYIIFFFIILIIIQVLFVSCSKENFESALPKGIKKEDIPKGDEDLYIKKTEIVPPVCPRCPDLIQKDIDTTKCPPCPACKRCPAPAEIECKKVLKYNKKSNNDLENAQEINEVNVQENIQENIQEINNVNTQGMKNVTGIQTNGALDLMNKTDVKIGSLLNNDSELRPVLADFSNF
jgi:hypothetical protein